MGMQWTLVLPVFVQGVLRKMTI